MKKFVLILLLLLVLLTSCAVERWNGIYCNDDNECKHYAGWLGHESKSCPEVLEFDYNTAEQYVSVREIYYLQYGTCVD